MQFASAIIEVLWHHGDRCNDKVYRNYTRSEPPMEQFSLRHWPILNTRTCLNSRPRELVNVISWCPSRVPILKFASDQVQTKYPDVNLIRPDPPTLPSLLWSRLSSTFANKLPRMPFTVSQPYEKHLAAFIATHLAAQLDNRGGRQCSQGDPQ